MAETDPQVTINIYASEGNGSGFSDMGSGSDVGGTPLNPVKAFMQNARKAVAFAGIGTSIIQLADYSVGRVGVETGNMQLQRDINIAKRSIGLAGAGIASIAAGGIVGGLAFGLSLGVSAAMQADTYEFNKRMSDTQLTIMRERAATYNRSRSTDQ